MRQIFCIIFAVLYITLVRSDPSDYEDDDCGYDKAENLANPDNKYKSRSRSLGRKSSRSVASTKGKNNTLNVGEVMQNPYYGGDEGFQNVYNMLESKLGKDIQWTAVNEACLYRTKGSLCALSQFFRENRSFS